MSEKKTLSRRVNELVAESRPGFLAVLLVTAVVIWSLSWAAIWIRRAGEDGSDVKIWIQEPAVVAISLGLIAIVSFVCIYWAESENKMRSAIAGTFILVFLLLIIDLLTIPDFRDSLAGIKDVAAGENGGGSPDTTGTTGTTAAETAQVAKVAVSFVEGLFGTFKWVVTAVIAFYFTAAAAEAITDKVQTERTERSKTDLAKAETDLATARTRAGFNTPE